MIKYEDFDKVEMRVGVIIEVEDFIRAKNPSYKVKVDFGEFGIKNSSAQLKNDYTIEELIGKQVICVTNFEPKNIAGFISEVLILATKSEDKGLSLLEVIRTKAVPGSRIY